MRINSSFHPWWLILFEQTKLFLWLLLSFSRGKSLLEIVTLSRDNCRQQMTKLDPDNCFKNYSKLLTKHLKLIKTIVLWYYKTPCIRVLGLDINIALNSEQSWSKNMRLSTALRAYLCLITLDQSEASIQVMWSLWTNQRPLCLISLIYGPRDNTSRP